MTNAIEQTRREMYEALSRMKKEMISGKCISVGKFESALEAHIEELRKGMVACNESTVKCAQHSAEAFIDLERRLATMTEERDTLRNKLQALQMASSTAAEVIRGLRSELEEAREYSRDDQLSAANSLIQRQRIEIANLYMRNVDLVQVQCAHGFHHVHEHCIYCGVRK